MVRSEVSFNDGYNVNPFQNSTLFCPALWTLASGLHPLVDSLLA